MTRKMMSEEERKKLRADLDEASRKSWHRMRGLSEVSHNFKSHFGTLPQFDEFDVMDQGEMEFRAYIFFKTDNDVVESEASGLSQQMRDYVYELLEKVGRGTRDQIEVNFEFDSWDNVQMHYEGNYFLRLR